MGQTAGFNEGALVYKSGDATAGYRALVAQLNRCKTFAGTSAGTKFSGTMAPLSLPAYGQQSAAFDIETTIQGVTVPEDLVVVRKGPVLLAALFGQYTGAVNTPDAEALFSKAVARVP